MNTSSINTYSTGYENLSTGYRIASAADDSAGLAISEKLETQSRGYDVGNDNANSGQDLLKTADGALSGITGSLQRIRELSLQASNTAINSDDDIQAMQDEVDQLKKQIQMTAKGTEFNTQKLLDGSKADLSLATNPNGTGMKIGLANSTLESLGIEDYDLTKGVDISKIDDALKKVNESRSSSAAQSNSLSYQKDYGSIASYNLTSGQSRIKDLDYGQSITDMKKDQVMQQYRNFVQMQKAAGNVSLQRLMT